MDSPTPVKLSGEHEHQSFWLWVMCLTGVDYFSTIGYQPSIAFDAMGLLAPLATLVLVAVTLLCALPVYCYVAGESPHGQGSISMLERLLRGWTAKFLVLILLGFAATDFVITKTLSAADAAEHLIHNPFWQRAPDFVHSQMAVTMFLLVLLGATFLRGFREVIYVAVFIVGLYLLLNAFIILSGIWHLAHHGDMFGKWWQAVENGHWEMDYVPLEGHSHWVIAAVCLLFFPKLALGLSGFETGVAVLPLVRGLPDDDPHRPAGRIRNGRKLLLTAALIMSVMLVGTSLVTTVLIRPEAMRTNGMALNRAMAFIAHGEAAAHISPVFGEAFGTLYDISTVAILWFAGASAMSGLLNLVPRYLPRFGMAPRWVESFRPLVLLFTCVNVLVTWIFDASVENQGEAYATGVLVLMTSAAVAVVIDQWHRRAGRGLLRVPWRYGVASLIFLYTTVAVVIEKPEGLQIATVFIISVIVFSIISRTQRSTELRFDHFEFVDEHSRLLWDSLRHLEFPVLVPHRPGGHTILQKEERIRRVHRLAEDVPIVYVEATLGDTSEFESDPILEVTQEEGRFILRISRCVSVAHALATAALELSKSGKPPELHFGWSNENPLAANLKFVMFGEGNVPWLVRELISKAEPDPANRPRVIIG